MSAIQTKGFRLNPHPFASKNTEAICTKNKTKITAKEKLIFWVKAKKVAVTP